MITVNVYIGSRYPVNRKVLREVARQTLREHGIEMAQVDISVVGSRKIKELNESRLKHEGKTDVLSFPQHERNQLDDFPLPEGLGPHLGDVVVSFPEAIKMAKRYGKRVDEQLAFYVQHGLMHLMGYHHE